VLPVTLEHPTVLDEATAFPRLESRLRIVGNEHEPEWSDVRQVMLNDRRLKTVGFPGPADTRVEVALAGGTISAPELSFSLTHRWAGRPRHQRVFWRYEGGDVFSRERTLGTSFVQSVRGAIPLPVVVPCLLAEIAHEGHATRQLWLEELRTPGDGTVLRAAEPRRVRVVSFDATCPESGWRAALGRSEYRMLAGFATAAPSTELRLTLRSDHVADYRPFYSPSVLLRPVFGTFESGLSVRWPDDADTARLSWRVVSPPEFQLFRPTIFQTPVIIEMPLARVSSGSGPLPDGSELAVHELGRDAEGRPIALLITREKDGCEARAAAAVGPRSAGAVPYPPPGEGRGD
jgi:hypothetical protein